MKQLFLPLALLTSGFVYSADWKSATITQVNFDDAALEVLQKLAKFRDPNFSPDNWKKLNAVCQIRTLISSEGEITREQGISGPAPLDANLPEIKNTKEYYIHLAKEDGEELKLSLLVQENSLADKVLDKAWDPTQKLS